MVCDILIIGSGIAGLSSAVTAKEDGANVVVATKGVVTKSNSVMAQGGMNVALGNVDTDNPNMHIQDTLKSSQNLANKEMVSKLCIGGMDAISFLERIGVPFSRLDGAKTPLASIAQRTLGGASAKRACYAQDYTGLKITHTLLDRAISLDIPIYQNMQVLELIKNSKNEVCGALFLDINSGKLKPIYANRVIIATGGFGWCVPVCPCRIWNLCNFIQPHLKVAIF